MLAKMYILLITTRQAVLFKNFFISGSFPTVTLKCISNCDTKLNFKERLIYLFDCEDCGYQRVVANWTIEDETGNFPLELSVQNASSTGFFTSSLVINKGILLESKTYTFTLVVGYENSLKKAKFKFKKSTCSQPTSGYCIINPAEGFALKTKFVLFCNGWRDSDGSLSYAFYYDNGQSQQIKLNSVTSIDYPILNAGTADQPSLINFIMGPGDESNDYKIRIIIKVIGKYQAYTEYYLYIKVYPNNEPINLKSFLTDISLNDTQSIANLVQAVSYNIKKNSANQYNITLSSVNELFDMIDEDTLKQQKHQELSSLQELRTQLIDLISNTLFNDLNSFKSISNALVVILQNPLEIVPHAQKQAAYVVDRLARLLTKKNLKGCGAVKFDTMSQSFINSISNLLQSAVLTPSLYQLKQDEQIISVLFNSMENYFIAAQSYKVPGDIITVGETKQFDFLIKKDIFIDLTSSFIGSSDGGFSLPDSRELFNESLLNSQILIHNVRMKDVVYTWDSNRSQNIRTETQTFFFTNSSGYPIEVRNCSQPINITIKNKPETMNGENISLYMPNDAYLVTLLISSGCRMLLKFIFKNDENNLTNLVVYIQYGKVVTKLDYDIMLNISMKQGVVMTKNNKLTNTAILGFNNKIDEYSTRVIQRNQDSFLLTDGAIILWNFESSTYSFLNKSELHLMFLYSGPMPAKRIVQNPYNFDETEYSGKYDYEMKSFCIECNYWNKDANKWMSDGCQLDVHHTSFLMTKCKCNHLTTFGGFFVAPNPLPKLSISKFKQGYALLVAVLVVISLWLLGLLITRRMDRQDISKIGVCPLADNRVEDTYLYQIIVNTGTRKNAGTKSNIFFTVVGETNDSGVRHLKNPERECFQRSSCDGFIMTTPSTLGDLDFIRLWHDNSGGGWYLKNIIIIDLQTEKRFVFTGHCWIAVDRGMCKLDCVIPVTSFEESSSFVFNFKSKSQLKLHDEHLWFSIFFRSPKSNFTRSQRLSVAVSLILTSMMVSTMFYQRIPPEDPAVENKAENFVLSRTQVYVVIISTCIKFPVNFILAKLFSSIRQFPGNMLHNCLSCNKNNIAQKESCSCVHPFGNNNSLPNKTKLSISIERYKLYIAWFICVGNILACGFIVLMYGIEFGNQKSINWLACVTIDFFKGILVLEPLKIFVVVIISILVLKKFNDEKEKSEVEKQGKILAFDESWLHKPKAESSIDSNCITMQPLDYSTVKKMREQRIKYQKMHTIVTEIILYIFYACLVLFIGYCSHDVLTCYQTRNVQELFNLKGRFPANPNIPIFQSKAFNQIQSSQDFWHWMEEFFLSQVFPEPWYNLGDFYANSDMKVFPGKQFLNDLTSKIVNGIRVRQVRVKPNSCTKPNSIAKFVSIDCLSLYKTTLEETRDFDLNWTNPKQYNSTINTLTMPWRYQTWQELDGYPYAASVDTYYGGGYVIELFSKWKNQVTLAQARKQRWIDRQTRAIIIEFALFNAATNYFNMVTMVLEFPASGGVVPNFSVQTFNLYASMTGSKTMLCSHILFILITILFTIRESYFLYRAGCKYFKEFWNLVEVALIILSIIAVGLFFNKDYLAKDLLRRVPNKKPQVFINFQFASYCDMMYISIVSLNVFFVTLKFIKLLQFNHRVSMISYTLKAAWYPLSMFGIVFFIVLCSFVTFSNIAFGAVMGEYKTYQEAIITTVSLLLGKFRFNQYRSVNSVLGPIFFFGFNVLVNWIIMNIFISILNDTFSIVRANPDYKNYYYEMVDFILKRVKGWFKHGQKKPLTKTRTHLERKFYPKSKVMQFVEYDRELSATNDPECLTAHNWGRPRVTFENFFNIQTFGFIKRVENKDLYADESTKTLFEDLLSKFDYLLNESKLDIEISETIDQIFDEDLFTKFIDQIKDVHCNNINKAKRKIINLVEIMDIEEEII
ncbi:location of vulva defective 1-like [Hydra vulgaris]|uniref:Location of vulva defective 1-like n=1 Tax=Hydra vulgaris TaxID=6087 RepID=A0ABM4BWM8_HYDVU